MSGRPEDARRVTVIVASRNDGPFTAAAIDGALAQEACEVEVLLIDDGSADEGPAGLRRLSDPRVRIVCQPPRGLARTWNLGLALARTRWVVLLPGHDVLLPGCLAALLDAAEAGDEPPAAAFVAARCTDARGAALDDDPASALAGTSRAALVEGLLAGEEPSPSGVLLDRLRVLRAGGFAPTLARALYRDLWLRLLLEGGEVGFVAERLVQRLVRRGVDARESAAEHAEHAAFLARALAGGGLDEVAAMLRPGATTREERAGALLEVARHVLRSGADEALGVAAEVAARARALGAALPDDEPFSRLARLHPGLAAAPAPSAEPAEKDGARAGIAASPGAARLTVALEVATLDRGGLETVVHDLALGLRDEAIEPLVVCTEAGGARAEALRRAGVEVVVLDPLDPRAHLARLLAERRVGLLNAHFSTLGARVAAGLGVPVVTVLHNAYAWVGRGVLEDFRAADPWVDVYVAVSQSVADFCARRFSIAPERIEVVRNGVRAHALAASSLSRDEARRALGVPDDARLVVQIGRIDPIKCQLATVEALGRLARERPEVVAWLVGGVGDPAYAHRVATRIRAAGLAEKVILTGERDDVPAILAAADVFVLPSVLEGLSLAALEAMAAGLPAVLTRTGDAELLLGGDGSDGPVLPGALVDGPPFGPYVAGDELNALAASDEPPHAARLAAALLEVLDDLPRRSALARERAAALAQELSHGAWIRRYAELFRTVAATGAARRSRALAAATARLDAAAERERRSVDALRESAETLSRVLLGNAAGFRANAFLLRVRWDLEGAHAAFLEGYALLERALDKLRIGHRIRTALEGLGRRSRGGAVR